MATIYYDYLMQDDQKIVVAATDHGICFVGSPNQPLSELTTFMPNHDLLQDPAKLAPVIDQITAYLTHKRTTWDLPLDFLVGTPFQTTSLDGLADDPLWSNRDLQSTRHTNRSANCDSSSGLRCWA